MHDQRAVLRRGVPTPERIRWILQPVDAADPAPPVLSIRSNDKDGESLTHRDKQSMAFKVLQIIDFTNKETCLRPINWT